MNCCVGRGEKRDVCIRKLCLHTLGSVGCIVSSIVISYTSTGVPCEVVEGIDTQRFGSFPPPVLRGLPCINSWQQGFCSSARQPPV